MRIFMQTKPGANESPRYCHLILQQDLLGGWTLIRESGGAGARVSVKREVFLEREAAERALTTQRDLLLRKGFQIMFAQGEDAPAGMGYET